MKINNKLKLAAAIAASMTLIGCGSGSGSSGKSDPCEKENACSASGYVFPADAIFVEGRDGDDITTSFAEAVLDSKTGSVIVLPKGTFTVSSSIIIPNASKLTLAGHGMNATILDFEGSQGDDGLSVTAGDNITLRDFGVHNANKNAIKATSVNGIHFNYTAAVWEDELTVDTLSAYGLYPVGSFNVLIENSYAKGSNDAGIYVGQSENIVVRNNIAEYNIAGIEIENSDNADVYNNKAFNNTGGILSFDLTGTSVKGFGTNHRFFNNETYDNNTTNVGHGVVGKVPSGTGFLVLASADVEIYNNTITNNNTTGVAITSYFLVDEDTDNYGSKYGAAFALGWTPTVKNVHVYNNTFTDNSSAPPTPVGGLLNDVINGYGSAGNASGEAQTMPAVVYDGVAELAANAGSLAAMGIDPYAEADLNCVHDNINNNGDELTLNIGSVYGVDPSQAGNIVDGDVAATLRISEMGDDATILNCENTPERLDPAVVTINGVVYGCTGDDKNLAACKL